MLNVEIEALKELFITKGLKNQFDRMVVRGQKRLEANLLSDKSKLEKKKIDNLIH